MAVAPLTASGIFAVGAKLRAAGLYSSAFVVPPAAISTLPSGSSVAVCPDWATPSGPVAANVFGGPSPPVVAAVAVVASTGRIRPETRAPVQVTTAMRWRAQRGRFITRQCHHAGQPKQSHACQTFRRSENGSHGDEAVNGHRLDRSAPATPLS